MRLVVLLGFTGGVEYHPFLVMRQFGFRHDAFVESAIPEFFRLYPLNLADMTTKLARLIRCGVQSIDIAVTRGSGCTFEYVTEVQETWPISEIPPGSPLFSEVGSSKRARTSSDR